MQGDSSVPALPPPFSNFPLPFLLPRNVRGNVCSQAATSGQPCPLSTTLTWGRPRGSCRGSAAPKRGRAEGCECYQPLAAWWQGEGRRQCQRAARTHATPWLCGLAAVAQGKRVRTRPHLAQHNPLMAALLQRHPQKTAQTNTPRSKLLHLHLFSSLIVDFFQARRNSTASLCYLPTPVLRQLQVPAASCPYHF